MDFDSIVCQADIKSEEDKQSYQSKGYHIELTVGEFKEKYKVDPKNIYYTPSISFGTFYFNRETLAVCPFHLECFQAQENGINMGLTVDGAYKTIEQREKEVANNDFVGSLMTLSDPM